MIVGHTKTIKGHDTEFFFSEIDSLDLINKGSSKKIQSESSRSLKIGLKFSAGYIENPLATQTHIGDRKLHRRRASYSANLQADPLFLGSKESISAKKVFCFIVPLTFKRFRASLSFLPPIVFFLNANQLPSITVSVRIQLAERRLFLSY